MTLTMTAPVDPRHVAVRALARRLTDHSASRETAAKTAAVAVVVREVSGDLETLFIRRSEHPEDPWSGHMAFPGGRVDPDDADEIAAARRETLEELGLDLGADATLLGRLSTVPVMARGRRLPMVIEPFVFHLAGAPPELSPNHEVEEALWIPVGFFHDPANRETFRWQRGDLSARLPCYHWGGRKIWGLTLRMVDELVRLAAGPAG